MIETEFGKFYGKLELCIYQGFALSDYEIAVQCKYPVMHDAKVIDHLDNTFDSKLDLAEYYGITLNELHEGLVSGKPLYRILSKPTVRVKDNKGNQYYSLRDMLSEYNIPYPVYKLRRMARKDVFDSNFTVTEKLMGWCWKFADAG